MRKLPRSIAAAAVATAVLTAGALASACGSGNVASASHVPNHRTNQETTTPRQGNGVRGSGHSGGSRGGNPHRGSSNGTTNVVTTKSPPPPTITVLPPTSLALTPASPTGSQLPASKIPWSKVGPGWTLAIWNPTVPTGNHPITTSNELLLVDPVGQAYVEDDFPGGADNLPTIADWSGNRHNALILETAQSGTKWTTTVLDVDLVDGSTVSRFDVPTLQSIAFTRPSGAGFLIQASRGQNSSVIARTNVDGQVEMTFGEGTGPSLYSPDGTQLLMEASGGLNIVSNVGAPVAHLPVKGQLSCSPLSWWGPGQVLASCNDKTALDDYIVSLSGAAPVLLGPDVSPGMYDEVTNVGGSVFANMGACSAILLVKLVKGQWKFFSIPGTVEGSSQVIVGTYGNDVEVNATSSCGSRQQQQPSLFWYDPVTNTSSLFFGSTHGGGVLFDALGFSSTPQARQELI